MVGKKLKGNNLIFFKKYFWYKLIWYEGDYLN